MSINSPLTPLPHPVRLSRHYSPYNFTPIHSRTVSFYHFFPSTINLWNSLPDLIKSSTFLSYIYQIKTGLNQFYYLNVHQHFVLFSSSFFGSKKSIYMYNAKLHALFVLEGYVAIQTIGGYSSIGLYYSTIDFNVTFTCTVSLYYAITLYHGLAFVRW